MKLLVERLLLIFPIGQETAQEGEVRLADSSWSANRLFLRSGSLHKMSLGKSSLWQTKVSDTLVFNPGRKRKKHHLYDF